VTTKPPKTFEKRGLTVEVRNNNIDKAIRVLARKVKMEGIVRELRARQAFEKPSDKRRRRKAEAVRRVAKAARAVVD
jgi:small subunit ribosomal protein S21